MEYAIYDNVLLSSLRYEVISETIISEKKEAAGYRTLRAQTSCKPIFVIGTQPLIVKTKVQQ